MIQLILKALRSISISVLSAIMPSGCFSKEYDTKGFVANIEGRFSILDDHNIVET